jgi:O-antigen ligase
MLAVILICVCVVLMNLSFFGNLYDSLLVLLHPTEPQIMSAFSGRFVIWNMHLAKFAQSSTLERLLGHGLGSDTAIYHEMSDVLSPTRESNHSDFIRNLSDLGLAGLGIYLLILVLLGKELLSSIKREGDPSFRAFGQAVFLIFIGFLLLSNVAAPSMNPSLSWYLWGFAGIIIGRRLLNNRLQQK